MIEEVSRNVFFIQSPNQGCNVFLLVGKQLMLVDSSLSANASLLRSSLKEIGFLPEDVEIILHTHGHADHFSCDGIFKNAKAWMSQFDGTRVSVKDSVFSCSEMFSENYFPKIQAFFSKNELIQNPPFRLSVISTPGHTEGSVCFFDQSKKLLFSGDTLFNGSAGRFDFVSGSRQKLCNSLQLVSQLDFDLLLPGHGPVLNSGQKQNIKNIVDSLFV